MSKVINICNGKKCCPTIRENTKTGIMNIVGDDGQVIPFTGKQVKNLKRYLDNRGM